MSNRKSAKQRRQAKNRQERDERAARRQAAARAASAPRATAPVAEPVATRGKGPGRGRETRRNDDRSVRPSRPAPAASRAGGADVRPAPRTAVGTWFRRVTDQPGGRWVMIALLGAVVGSAMLAFFPVYQRPSMPEAARAATQVVHEERVAAAEAADEDPPPEWQEPDPTYVSAYLLRDVGPGAGILLAVPVAITGLAAVASRRADPSRSWIISAFAMVLFVMSPFGVGLLYLASAVALGIAAYQSRKANPRVVAPRREPVPDGT